MSTQPMLLFVSCFWKHYKQKLKRKLNAVHLLYEPNLPPLSVSSCSVTRERTPVSVTLQVAQCGTPRLAAFVHSTVVS